MKLPILEKIDRHSINFSKRTAVTRGTYFLLYISGVCIIFLIFIIRLFQLTVVKGDYYRRLADENRMKSVIIEAERGTILDRKGLPLAKNSPASHEDQKERLVSTRSYFEPEANAHLLGYRQLASPEDFQEDPCLTKLKLGDKVGKKGIEKAYECELRGRSGEKLIEVSARGELLKVLMVVPPEAGKTIRLAVDLELQQKAYEAMKDKKGAVIATKPRTGEILAFVSTPAFNPQDFENTKKTRMARYLEDEEHPLFNRITEATYPPGSIFKLFVATGALEEKKIDEDTQFEDTGTITAGSLKFGNWYFLQYGKTDGMVNIVKGLRRSNDIFFYRAGSRLGPEHIRSWALLFGLGKKSAFAFDQAEGLIPSPYWKEEVLGEQWYLGDSYNFAIGQGYALVSPLQINQAAAVFANGGFLCEPKLLKNEKPGCKKLNISVSTMDLVREGMRQACTPGGTGWPLFEFSVISPQLTEEQKKATDSAKPRIKIPVACKTGTAEARGEDDAPHAWFTAYAPVAKPEIVVTVLVEEGGQGSDVAAPIAKEILTSYFGRSE